MFYRKVFALSVALLMVLFAIGITSAKTDEPQTLQSIEPLNIAVLIQDDLVSQVANEIGVTKEFIRSLPQGSRVMVGYLRAGSLQVKQPFTTDLEAAAKSLRMPVASTASSPFKRN